MPSVCVCVCAATRNATKQIVPVNRRMPLCRQDAVYAEWFFAAGILKTGRQCLRYDVNDLPCVVGCI